MCGISGICEYGSREVAEHLLRKMAATMHHRGPDNTGKLVSPRAGFAHNRLSIIDLSEAANQPFTDGEYMLVFNGEIYNFRQLRDELKARHSFTTESDTEVLFAALKHFGVESTLSRIQGMFAFAFHQMSSGQTWLARDRFGIKPLYFFSGNNRFVFASEVKAILAVQPCVTDRIKTVFSIYGSGDSDMHHTLFEGISQVKPGHWLCVSGQGSVEEKCYYSIEDECNETLYLRYSGMKREDVRVTFENLLTEAVQRMLVSDAPVGAFVSGGVDSSLLSALAVQQRNVQLFTSHVTDYGNELPFAKQVAANLNCELNISSFSKADYISNITKATWHYETPVVSHVNALPMAEVAGLAHQQQVKVVLSGEGSDELFLGYPDLLFNKYRNAALWPYKIVQKMYRIVPGLSSILPGHAKHILPQLNQDFYRQSRRKPFFEKVAYLPSEEEKEMNFQSVFMIRELLLSLLHRNDRMAMISSVEARFPFLYEPLVTFAMNLPLQFKYRRTHRLYNSKHPFLVDKSLVRDTANRYLPSAVAYRRKWGFGTNAASQIRPDSAFFANGYLHEILKLSLPGIRFMVENADTYTVSKLVAIEVFGRLYEYHQPLQQVHEHTMANLHMK